MVKVGITGGIGSGKSVVSHIVSAMGYPVYDCDRNAARIMISDVTVIEALKNLVGEDAYLADGSLNKPVIASFLYKDKNNREALNAIVHPAVFRNFEEWSANCRKEFVFVESAILFESGLDKYVDRSVMVLASCETRIERVMARDGIDREQAIKRLNSQMPDEEKAKLCDFIVRNDNGMRIVPQIYSLFDFLRG